MDAEPCLQSRRREVPQGNLKISMPRKIRQLVQELLQAGFLEVSGGGKGSHRKFLHPRFSGAVTLSGRSGDDAKPYQEIQLRRALEEVKR